MSTDLRVHKLNSFSTELSVDEKPFHFVKILSGHFFKVPLSQLLTQTKRCSFGIFLQEVVQSSVSESCFCRGRERLALLLALVSRWNVRQANVPMWVCPCRAALYITTVYKQYIAYIPWISMAITMLHIPPKTNTLRRIQVVFPYPLYL